MRLPKFKLRSATKHSASFPDSHIVNGEHYCVNLIKLGATRIYFKNKLKVTFLTLHYKIKEHFFQKSEPRIYKMELQTKDCI